MKFSFATLTATAWLVSTVTSTSLPGDECITAIVVPPTSLPFNQVINNTIYSNNVLDPIATCNYGSEGKTVFFKFTPNNDGLLVIDLAGSVSAAGGPFFDSIISVFKGNCNSLEQIFCSDRYFDETVYYVVDTGVTYTIKIAEEGDGDRGYGVGQLNTTVSLQRSYFNLVNEDDGTTIEVLNDLYSGAQDPYFSISSNTINYADSLFGTDLSIEAIFSKPNDVASVRLQLDNQRSVCENDNDEFKI